MEATMTKYRRFLTFAAAGMLLSACEDVSTTSPELAPNYSRAEPQYEFESIHLDGAVATNPQGINAAGHIVGAYVQGGVTRGFLLKDGVAETIVVEGAGFTFARGIGPDGTIVGNWRPAGVNPVVSFGFKRSSDGTVTTIGFAGKTHVIPQRILADGTVFGCAHDNDLMGSMIGVTMNTSADEAVDLFASMHNGGTPDGRNIIGLYTNMDAGNRGEGYLISDGQFTPLLVPDSRSTAAWDMNARGDVVGNYQSADGRFHGFVLTEAGYTTLDFPAPGVTATRAFGINNRGDVVGHYVLGGVTRGFVARRVR
jgi:uncharacterized membrane protein